LNHDPVLNYPDGHRLIELAIQTWASGRRDDHWLIEPNYLRQSSAEELWDARRPPRAD
jgi:tRNA A37 threonylcarbamoyladenosine modification protein TsaB